MALTNLEGFGLEVLLIWVLGSPKGVILAKVFSLRVKVFNKGFGVWADFGQTAEDSSLRVSGP